MDLYTCGECPICAETGDLLVVKNPVSQALFVFCHNCGCAWSTPPPPHEVNQVEPRETYAPGGFVLPTEQEISIVQGRGWPARRLEELDDWWRDILGPNLAQGE